MVIRSIIQTKVPEELTQSALNSQGDGESYTEGDWISMEYVVASDDYRPLKHTQILNHKAVSYIHLTLPTIA